MGGRGMHFSHRLLVTGASCLLALGCLRVLPVSADELASVEPGAAEVAVSVSESASDSMPEPTPEGVATGAASPDATVFPSDSAPAEDVADFPQSSGDASAPAAPEGDRPDDFPDVANGQGGASSGEVSDGGVPAGDVSASETAPAGDSVPSGEAGPADEADSAGETVPVDGAAPSADAVPEPDTAPVVDAASDAPSAEALETEEAPSRDVDAADQEAATQNAWIADVALSSTSVAIGSSLTVTPLVNGSSQEGYSYNYLWNYEGAWDEWGSTVLSTGTTTAERSWTFAPTKAGRYQIHVDVSDSTGRVQGVDVWVDVYEPQWGVELSVSAGMLTQGAPVTVISKIHGCQGVGYTYNYVWNYEGAWQEWGSTVLDAGNPTSEASWTFRPTKAGRYLLHVDAVAPNGKLKTSEVWVDVAAPSWSASLVLSATKVDVVSGEGIVVTPKVVGADPAGFTFNYLWNYEGAWDEWGSTVLEEGKPTTDTSWTFVPSRLGRYQIHVDVSDANGVTRGLDVWVEAVEQSWDVSVSLSEDLVTVGDSITVVAEVDGIDASEFRYNYVWNYSGDWSDWESAVLATGEQTVQTSWPFKAEKAGRYQVIVDAVSPSGKVVSKECWVDVVDLPWSLSLSVDTAVELGDTLSVAPCVSGSDAEGFTYNYVWNYEGAWGEWGSTVLDEGVPTGEATWDFVPAFAGRYLLHVDATDTNGKVRTAETWVEVVDPAGSSWSLGGLGLSGASYALGEPITVAPVVANGDAATEIAYNYLWNYEGAWGEWSSTVLEEGAPTTDSSRDFTPKKTGWYQLHVDATDLATNRVVSADAWVYVYDVWGYAGLQLSSRGYTAEGDRVVLTSQTFGDTDGVTYRYYVRCSDGTLEEATGVPSADGSAFTWVPQKAGSYTVVCEATAPDGSTQTGSCSVNVASRSTMGYGFTMLEGGDFAGGPVLTYYDKSGERLYGSQVVEGSTFWFDETTGATDQSTYLRWQIDRAGSFGLFGGATAAQWVLDELDQATSSFYAQGYSLGYLMIDLATGKGVARDLDTQYYSASTVKGPYVTSLYKYAFGDNASKAQAYQSHLENAIRYSDNDEYLWLRSSFGTWPIRQLLSDAGVSSSKAYLNYVWYSPRELAKIWVEMYEYFENGSAGQQCSSLYSSSAHSAIYNQLGGRYPVRSKPGWYPTEYPYTSTNDAGIVYAGDRPYLLVVLSNAPERFDMLQRVVAALENVHATLQ